MAGERSGPEMARVVANTKIAGAGLRAFQEGKSYGFTKRL
jgi:hypothetical protein